MYAQGKNKKKNAYTTPTVFLPRLFSAATVVHIVTRELVYPLHHAPTAASMRRSVPQHSATKCFELATTIFAMSDIVAAASFYDQLREHHHRFHFADNARASCLSPPAGCIFRSAVSRLCVSGLASSRIVFKIWTNTKRSSDYHTEPCFSQKSKNPRKCYVKCIAPLQ